MLPNDESHYFDWTQKVLGANGEKASAAMKKVLKEQGAGALAEMLKNKYAAEHDIDTSVEPAKPKSKAKRHEPDHEPPKRTRRS